MASIRHTYRLRPSKTARLKLEREWNATRWLWNHMNETRIRLWREEGRSIRFDDTNIAALRCKHEWLKDHASAVLQQEARKFFATYSAAFKKRREHVGEMRPDQYFPKFKSWRSDLPSLSYARNGFSIRENGIGPPRLFIAKVGEIPVVWSRNPDFDASSVVVYRDALGHWYASFVVQDDRTFPTASIDSAIGIDWGVKTTAVTTDDAFDLPNRKWNRSASTKLAKAQQKMSRRHRRGRGVVQSKGYDAARRETAKIYAKSARQAKDDINKWTKKVVDAHKTIAVEDFKPKFMQANRSLARAASDARPGMAKQAIISLGKRAARNVVLVAPAYTTQTCSSCGTRAKSRITLDTRVFDCYDCGYVEDRDRNAARNILAWAGQPQ